MDVLAVFAHHYVNWEDNGTDAGGDRDLDVHDEETGAPRLVGVFTTIRDAADACYTFITTHEADEEDPYGGPIESVAVYGATLNSVGSGRHLASLPLNGDKVSFEKALLEARQAGGTVR